MNAPLCQDPGRVPGLRAFVWGKDNDAAAKAIRDTSAPFKVILKTRNEDLLLPKWLAHYQAILETRGSIIILDNMSDSERVFGLYRQYADEIILIRYEGIPDSAHSLKKFAELYEAVWASSRFYALFDTDEFLTLYDGIKLLTGPKIVRYLEHNTDAALFPTLFLNNILAREDAFIFEEHNILQYHLMGKPILNSRLMQEKLYTPVGHTCNLPLPLFSGKIPLGFVLFHMSHISRELRITSNLQKLRHLGLMVDETNMANLFHAELDKPEIPHIVAEYITELRYLAGIENEEEAIRQALCRDHITVSPDGALSFSREALKNLFANHVSAKLNLLDVLPVDAAKLRDMTATLGDALLPAL